jgi:DNA-directed RNA polymerase subunit E"
MIKKNVCKNCKMFYEGNTCPGCKSSQKATTWKGRINVLNPNKSDIAKKMGIEVKGEYAIKIR